MPEPGPADPIEQYLTDVDAAPPLTPEEQPALAAAITDGGEGSEDAKGGWSRICVRSSTTVRA